MASTLSISDEARALMCEAAEHAFPKECCGLLIGVGGDSVIVSQAVVAPNLSEEPNRFLIDPQVHFDWLRKLRGTTERIVGHFHSHPNGSAEPSKTDSEMAIERDQYWVIIPVKDGVSGYPHAYIARQPEEPFLRATLIIE
jgi:proteasome lid subunit RPN8/RPN11